MPIEGPLRELGIHDVFQLLDLSRKTGVLRVASALREDEGLVFFDGGRVVQASIRSKPVTDPLVENGSLSRKELERHLRLQIESVVFELMSWREGFFSFEERSRETMPPDSRIRVSTESLLMEGARRIDEWSRIADLIPNLSVIPALAPVDEAREGSLLDLLPHEWQVLTMIDGERDLRAIAAALGRDEFEVAKIAYGLTTTGIIVVHSASRLTPTEPRTAIDARLEIARRHVAEGRVAEALGELRRATREDPLEPDVHFELGFVAARAGELATARASWEHFLRLAPAGAKTDEARAALNAVMTLEAALGAHERG